MNVKFLLPSIKMEARMMHQFLSPRKTGWDWSDRVYRNYPELKDILEGVERDDERYRRVYSFVRRYIQHDRTRLQKLMRQYQKEWDSINDAYLSLLFEYVDTPFPSRRRMYAFVSIVPIFPRFLDSWSFNVSSQNTNMMIPIAMHEILHFVYFKKWMEVFPDTERRELDSPYLVWYLSEILAPIILRNHPDIQRIYSGDHHHYGEFDNMYIEAVPLMEHFTKLYKKHVKEKTSFEDFLRIVWKEAKKYKGVIVGK
jgi:hypothetical protein